MMKLSKYLLLAPLAFAFGCEPEFDETPSFNGGTADFSSYVAVGNSLTAGYQSSALKASEQMNSLPAIMAAQFKQVGGGDFKQPLIGGDRGANPDPSMTNPFEVSPSLKLGLPVNCLGAASLGPVPDGDNYDGTAALYAPIGADGPYNNVGVPGALSFHMVAPGYGNPANIPTGNANPFYSRFVNPNDADETVVAAAMRTNPTFFSLWIGNNDVLGYATSGGSSGAITSQAMFDGALNGIVSTLVSGGAKGCITNIPYVTSIPYFTTVAWNGLTLDQTSADQLNAAYAAYNAGLDAAVMGGLPQAEADRRKMSFSAGDNAFVITDNTLTDLTGSMLPSVRQIASNELLTLVTPGDSIRCAGWGTQTPIPEQYTLIESEISDIRNAVDGYNATLKNLADANGLAFVDANKLLQDLESGLAYDGITYSTTFVTGGGFSLDGVHPNTRGYAILANEHIRAINAKYGAKIPLADINSFDGVTFP